MSYKTLAISLLAVGLGGCGFHFSDLTPPFPLCVKGSEDEVLLTYYSSTCLPHHYQLHVHQLSFINSPASVSANNNVRQYELKRFINFDLYNPQGKRIIRNMTFANHKPLVIDSNAILSSNNERDILLQEMTHQLVQQLNRYIHFRYKR